MPAARMSGDPGRAHAVARENLVKTRVLRQDPIVDGAGRSSASCSDGPREYLRSSSPEIEATFRILGKIAKLEVFETETFPAEDVKVFWKALV